MTDGILATFVEYIKRDYAEASINVLEALLEAHPDLWEMVDSLE